MIDWDYSENLTKDKIINLTYKFMENLKKSALNIKKITFRFYETDNGLHAFCTSQTFNHDNYTTHQIMLAMNCDPMYVAFVKLRGFAIRMTPKVTKINKNGTPQYINDGNPSFNQFVQRPLLDDNGNQIVIGDKDEIFSLVNLANFIYQSQRKIIGIENIVYRLQDNDYSILKEITDIVKNEYDKYQTKYIINTKLNPFFKQGISKYVEITEREYNEHKSILINPIKIKDSDKKLNLKYNMLPKF